MRPREVRDHALRPPADLRVAISAPAVCEAELRRSELGQAGTKRIDAGRGGSASPVERAQTVATEFPCMAARAASAWSLRRVSGILRKEAVQLDGGKRSRPGPGGGGEEDPLPYPTRCAR
jgi:hypothetical protein